MAIDQPTGDLRGLLLPWDLRTATLTASTEAAPRPGTPSPSGPTSLSVAMSGTPSKGETWIAATARGGVPEPLGATFRVRQSVADDWSDWDPPVAISDFEFIARSTTANKWTKPHGARLPGGRPIVVAVQDTDTVVAHYQSVEGVWSSVSIEDTGADTCACVDVLPSGRVLVWYVREVATTTCQIRLAYSADGGETWQVASARCLYVPMVVAASNIRRIRCKWVNGNAILLVSANVGTADFYWQYGSSDGGRTFYDVLTYQSAVRTAPEIAIRNGEILVAWIERDTALANSTLVPKLYRIGSVGTAFSTVTGVTAVNTAETWEWGTYSGGEMTAAELAMAVDDDGVIYLYGLDYDATATLEVRVSRSYDGGTSWDTPLSAPEAVYYSGDTSTYPIDLAAVVERGRVMLLHRFEASPGTADDSLAVMYLGGWTKRARPWLTSFPWDQANMGWDVTWLPYDEPDNTGTTWTRSATGAPTSTLGSNGLTISQGGGEALSFYANPATGSGNGYGICALLSVPAITSGKGFVDVRISDATNAYAIRVSWEVSGLSLVVVLRDLFAGADLDSDSITLATGLQVYLILQHPGSDWTLNDGHVRACYRSTSGVSGPSPDKEWTNLTGSTTLTSGASATNLVQWGGLTGALAQTFGFVCYAQGSSILDDTVARDGFPTRGRGWCPPTTPAYLGRYGARIAATGGPTDIGDVWTAPAAYDYPIAAVDPWQHPSPSRKWRASGLSQTDITWASADRGLVTGDIVGIYFQGVNFASAALYADTGAATKIADVDLRIATGLGFTRTRGVIYPTGAAGTASTTFFPENALAGCYWQYSVGGTVRKIKGNTAGGFLGSGSGATTYRGVRIELENWDAADASSGTAGILRSDRGVIITDIATSTDTLMLRIDSQAAAETYLTGGIIAAGRVWLMGQQYSWGRTVEMDSGVVVSESATGARRVSRPRGARRAVEFAWVDGVDQSKLYASGGPNYITLGYGSAPPVQVARADLPTAIHGLLASAAAECPVVYLPAVPQQGSAPTATAPIRIVEPSRMLYGLITTTTHRIDTIVGDEYDDPGELVRVGTLRIEEEL